MGSLRYVAGAVLVIMSAVACGSDESGGGSGGGSSTGGSGISGAGSGGAPTGGGGASTGGVATGGIAGTGSVTTGGSAGASGAAGASGSGGATACNTLVNEATAVGEVAASGTLPTPTGGTIADGTYVITKFEVYPPGQVTSKLHKNTMKVLANSIEAVGQVDSDPEVRGSLTYSTNAGSIQFQYSCPVVGTDTVGYSATANEIVLLIKGSGFDEARTWTKK